MGVSISTPLKHHVHFSNHRTEMTETLLDILTGQYIVYIVIYMYINFVVNHRVFDEHRDASKKSIAIFLTIMAIPLLGILAELYFIVITVRALPWWRK